MYRRKIEAKLLAWKQTPNHKPLIIKGVRQCGKTSSVKQFAATHYESVIYMDFHEQKELRTIFDGSLSINHLKILISSSLPEAQFIPGKTCIIFDEIQECPGARASLKFWRQDGQYDVICTGSLLGVNGYKSDEEQSQEEYSIPVGSEMIVDMYPMDFEEWLWANNIPTDAIELLQECLAEEKPVPEALHLRFRQLLLEYMVVGGMPEAVLTMLTTHDMNQVIAVQRSIIQEYRADMVKYARSEDKARIIECFDSIPRQLSKENKKFQYSVVRHGGRSKEYVSCLQWIEDAGIIRRCYNTSITELPLSGNAIDTEFKVYLADTGLFVSMLDPGTQGDILRGNLLSYKGALFENIVADILGKMERKLYYYHKESGLELDFLIRHHGECVPVECKAVTGKAQSLKTVMKHPEKYNVHHALKFGDYNIGRNGGILTLPMYMAFLITEI